jgi:hypothetical protein
MADIQPLKTANDLHWNYLADRQNTLNPLVRYDERADLFMLLFISPEQETVVFYADSHVGLLINPETLEVVGLQVEAFKKRFLQEHDSLEREWRLSETGLDMKDFGDLMLRFENRKRRVAREVIRATEYVLGEPASELVAALA